ncbi:hypothetical protein BDV25DRAFT_77252 [Aspergillus avenaceus]|uniref:Uncharacterized protein n=1 Tax=Aspergillus avenaceus TaxID=36643 RepID=A0A5N6TFT5_ASPAV|nr:hypothetical protein BDV25DRAFT_77252 [Aspergillus avenaceus]
MNALLLARWVLVLSHRTFLGPGRVISIPSLLSAQVDIVCPCKNRVSDLGRHQTQEVKVTNTVSPRSLSPEESYIHFLSASLETNLLYYFIRAGDSSLNGLKFDRITCDISITGHPKSVSY